MSEAPAVKFTKDLTDLIDNSEAHVGDCMVIMAMVIGRIISSCREREGDEMAARVIRTAMENLCEHAGAEVSLRLEGENLDVLKAATVGISGKTNRGE